MSLPELVITNPPPKFVRARYLNEVKKGRGLITGADGNVQLEVRNKTGEGCFIGAKCTAKVKSVATKQDHACYTLFNSEWDVTIEENGLVKVDLDHLALVWPKKCNEEQKRDVGQFYLEFALRFAKEYQAPDLICCTVDMFDESCKETCRPKIKDVIPQCAAGGEKVCIECTSDVAKLSRVEAFFSGMIGDSEVHFSAAGQVSKNLVKIKLPHLNDDSIKDMTKLNMRLRVNKNENIVSDPVTFVYYSKKFCRPKITDCDEEMTNSRTNSPRTYQTPALIEFPSINTKSGVVTGLIQPKGMSHRSNLGFGESESSKAFHDTKNQCQDEKVQNTSNPCFDIVRKAVMYTMLDKQIKETVNGPTISTTNEVITPHPMSFNQEVTLPSTVIQVESRPQAHKPQLNGQEVQPLERHLGLSHQVNANTGLSGIQLKCNTEESISAPSAGKDLEKLRTFVSDTQAFTGYHLDLSPNHSLNDNTCPLRTPNKAAPDKISSFEALTLPQMNTGVTENHSDLSAKSHLKTPTTSKLSCSLAREEERPSGNLSALSANEDVRNEQKCIMSMASMNEYVPPRPPLFTCSNNLNTGPGPMDILVRLTEEFEPGNLPVSAFDDMPNCHTPLAVENFAAPEIIPIQVTDENSPQSCYMDSALKNKRLSIPVLNHSNDPPFHSPTSTPQPISNDNDYSGMDIDRESLNSAIQDVELMGSESFGYLCELLGNKDILKAREGEGSDKNAMKRRSVSNYPACSNHNPFRDLHGQPKAKVRKLHHDRV